MIRFFVILILLLANIKLKAQNIDVKFFEAICNGLAKEDKYHTLHINLFDTHIKIDPVSGKRAIIFDKRVSQITLKQFNNLSPREQERVLDKDRVPILPLSDTLYIIDTLNFLHPNLFYNATRFYKVSNSRDGVSGINVSLIYLYAVGIRENYIVLSFSFDKSDLLYNMYFEVQQDSLILSKTSLLDPKEIKY